MIRNSFPPSAFQDIKPSGTMSCEEAISFLDGLFSVDPESQDTYSIDEESLLAEIFGRFAAEFDFDFELDDTAHSLSSLPNAISPSAIRQNRVAAV